MSDDVEFALDGVAEIKAGVPTAAPDWEVDEQHALHSTTLAGSLSAGAVSITRKRLTVKSSISTSPRCTLRRLARKIDSRAMASAPMAKAP